MIIKPPASTDINRIADWTELYVLSIKGTVSKAKILSLLQGEGVNFEEEDVDSVFQELSRRLNLYGDTKPFNIEGNKVASNFTWKEYPEYTLCLYYSTYGATQPDDGTKLFEEITKTCLEVFLSCKGYMFGFPNKKSFKTQLDEFAKEIKASRFEDPNKTDKDRGVDIVIYKEFDTVRNNSILLFTQCAAGKNWNDKKPVSIPSFHRYMQITPKTTLSSLAITQIIDMNDWSNACDDYGIIIDRARLFRILSNSRKSIPKELITSLIAWCKSKLN